MSKNQMADLSTVPRKSSFPMISVDEALSIVLQNVESLGQQRISIMESYGRILAENVVANEPFPTFRASIMDGYAVIGPIQANSSFQVSNKILAGSDIDSTVDESTIAYITTGAKLPNKANSVVKVEDTILDSIDKSKVIINVDIPIGANIRQIGSDIALGEIIAEKYEILDASTIGLLASAGVYEVSCISKPVIGIMSTGDELVEYSSTPMGSQVRDSNRASLITNIRKDGYDVLDLGIIRDQIHTLESSLSDAIKKCDVIITSGGVSMGDADLVKPLLAKLGTIHFGRLNMKPGKPTTFATIYDTSNSHTPPRKVYIFGLPGNPVSCLVTKSLLIDPCLKRLQGLNHEQSMPSQIQVKLESYIKLDMERPEYHRAIVTTSSYRGSTLATAKSTGDQRSSRMLSMRYANAFLCLPQGTMTKTHMNIGDIVTAILTGPLPPPSSSICYHQHIFKTSISTSSISIIKDSVNNSSGNDVMKKIQRPVMKVGLLTISDRASQGIYEDLSGPEMQKLLESLSQEKNIETNEYIYPLEIQITHSHIVPDEKEQIQEIVISWVDNSHIDLILTSGGTGFGHRDITPEAIKFILHREAPGIAQSLLSEGLKFTPLAVLSRPVVGTRHHTLICTLPGSVKAVRENFTALKPLLPRIMELLQEDRCVHHI